MSSCVAHQRLVQRVAAVKVLLSSSKEVHVRMHAGGCQGPWILVTGNHQVPYGVVWTDVHGTSAAPGPQQGLNASSAPDQPTQITDLLAPAPAGGQTPPPAVPPTRGGEDPRTNPQSGRSRGDTCENQGLSGQCKWAPSEHMRHTNDLNCYINAVI